MFDFLIQICYNLSVNLMHTAFDCRAVLRFRIGGKNQPLPQGSLPFTGSERNATIAN